MNFKAAARKVLEEVGHPLHYSDITDITTTKVVLGFVASLGEEETEVEFVTL